jgi:hypothetical protein
MNSEKDTISLIHLQPSNDLESGIHCSLKYGTLTDYQDGISDQYTAVSYA